MYKNKWESPKNKTSNWCSSIIKIPEEPSLDDSFWIVGVQTNYFYKKNFWH